MLRSPQIRISTDIRNVPKRNCVDLVSLLADYVEHQLPPDVHARLEHHLAECPRCVAQLKTYESTLSLLHRSVTTTFQKSCAAG